MKAKKVCLVVLDGWGHGPSDPQVNAILKANTPFVDSLYEQYPNSELLTSGLNVGLPEGQMGNSEVGHMNIGAGRVVYQQLVRINRAFESGEAAENKNLLSLIEQAKTGNKRVHLIGLLSDGGVHSHMNHAAELCKILDNKGINNIFLHAFTDGRDTDPKSGIRYLNEFEHMISGTGARIASIIGRYWSMDRDKKWDRIKKAYDLLIHGKGTSASSANEAMEQSYRNGVTDEFAEPVILHKEGVIQPGDVVINFNFRTDRGRQISSALTQEAFPEFDMKPIDIIYATMTEYDATYHNVSVLFPTVDLINTLGEVLAKNGKTQLRIAETEKYPHVTFFFSGGRETLFDGESRILCQSPKVATYDLAPEMSAKEVTTKAKDAIRDNHPDFIMLNYANADMVGHTGIFDAVVQAVETVDSCLEELVQECLANDYAMLITADHGNADFEVNPDGSPNTAHTTNPVPLFLLEPSVGTHTISSGKLADLAPTVIELMELEKPSEMDGISLLS